MMMMIVSRKANLVLEEHNGAMSTILRLIATIHSAKSFHLLGTPMHSSSGGGAPAPTSVQVTDLDLGEYYSLTAFTLGYDYECSLAISTNIHWFVVGKAMLKNGSVLSCGILVRLRGALATEGPKTKIPPLRAKGARYGRVFGR